MLDFAVIDLQSLTSHRRRRHRRELDYECDIVPRVIRIALGCYCVSGLFRFRLFYCANKEVLKVIGIVNGLVSRHYLLGIVICY